MADSSIVPANDAQGDSVMVNHAGDPKGQSLTPPNESDRSQRARHTRRELLTAAVAGAAGYALHGLVGDADSHDSGPTPLPSPSTLPRQLDVARRPGITDPDVPQRRIWIGAVSLRDGAPRAVRDRAALAMRSLPELPSDGGEVTVTIGFSVPLSQALWPERAAAAVQLPPFVYDADDIRVGGDLIVQVCAETADAITQTSRAVLAVLGAPEVVWEQRGYRDAGTAEGTTRTGLGFTDGIINPRTEQLRAAGVWSDAEHRDTYLAVRRMRIDPSFMMLPLQEQERAVGRRRDTGEPLSGGGMMAEVDLLAKAPDGHLLTPPNAHVRRAHPSNLGRALMLRRSYSYDPSNTETGLIFIAFIADPMTFIATQHRLDEADDLIAHTRTDAGGLFFVPGDLA